MKFTVNITEEEKKDILVNYMEKSLPDGYELADVYPSIGEFIFKKVEADDSEEHE